MYLSIRCIFFSFYSHCKFSSSSDWSSAVWILRTPAWTSSRGRHILQLVVIALICIHLQLLASELKQWLLLLYIFSGEPVNHPLNILWRNSSPSISFSTPFCSIREKSKRRNLVFLLSVKCIKGLTLCIQTNDLTQPEVGLTRTLGLTSKSPRILLKKLTRKGIHIQNLLLEFMKFSAAQSSTAIHSLHDVHLLNFSLYTEDRASLWTQPCSPFGFLRFLPRSAPPLGWRIWERCP